MNQKILQVQNLSIGFFEGQNVVQNVSFDLYQNEILGIVGESGSGKSVTALSILGLLNAHISSQSSIKFEGQNLDKSNFQMMQFIRGGKIGFIFQEPMSSLNPLHQIGKQIAENIIIHQKLSKSKAKEQAILLMKRVGLKNPVERYKAYPYELSGGERQRVMIAMAIANNPKILIADEPTTALDVTIQKQIIELITELKNELGMAVIFISHDLKLVSQIADRIAVMYQGKMLEIGTAKDIFQSPKEDYTKKLILSSNILKNYKKIKNNTLIDIQNLSVSYPIKKNFFGKIIHRLKALDEVSFDIYEGETLGVVGESGSGKTTLGQAVTHLIDYKGKITYPSSWKTEDFRKNVQIIFQDPYNSLNPRMNILEIVGEGLKIHHKNLSQSEIKDKVCEILKEVSLPLNGLYKYPHEFSGGERQRISIARAMILRPKFVVLDEPTSALDVTIQKQILTLLQNLQKKFGMTYIFISHDMRAVRAISDRIAVMKDGKIVELGSVNQILTHPQNTYTKSLIQASVF